ncbi:VOC family protein [Ruixingdingia sedimenti]|uniref:VOC family protein n=1 Tax=Ruixingdingia sedimenti TaxID=3073604 RepID=A0ABU1FDL5_9RHOB|nr:VOC family protein [Xinfangfangia sp. LG-4]MDR5654668.1 VOC family protein [Xinfangfangia sp. LG-4]
MPIEKIYAQLNCTDMERSAAWLTKLFGRPADAAPMDGLNEWHHADNAGVQLVRNSADAGCGYLTLIVGDIEAELARLNEADIKTEKVTVGDIAKISQLVDPDGNTVVLAQPM